MIFFYASIIFFAITIVCSAIVSAHKSVHRSHWKMIRDKQDYQY